MKKHEIANEVLHQYRQANNQKRIQVLEREILQIQGDMKRVQAQKTPNKDKRAPSIEKLQNELKAHQNEVESLTQFLTPFADGKPKTDRANA
jgi:capsule polysaccharide export protein KpsE/RkpR